MVLIFCLVHYHIDHTFRSLAEWVLCGCIGVSAGHGDAYRSGRVVWRPLDTIERAVEPSKQRTDKAVGGDARRAGRAENIAWPRASGGICDVGELQRSECEH
jgi:hypothetical protein